MRASPLKLASTMYYYKPMATLVSAFALSAYADLDLKLTDATLDLGCGNGEFMNLLVSMHNPAASVVGLDYDFASLSQARHRAASCFRLLLSGDARRLPFKRESFDFVIANMVIPAIPDTAAALSEISRILRPDGRFICIVRTSEFRKNFLIAKLLDRLRLNRMAERYRCYLDRRTGAVHVHRNVDQWRECFHEAGFRELAVRGAVPTDVVGLWDILTLPPFRVFGILKKIDNTMLRRFSASMQERSFQRLLNKRRDMMDMSKMSFVLFSLAPDSN